MFLSRFGPFFVEPIVAGLEPDTFEPYICNMDLIGCITEPTDFVAGGTCEEQLMGMCETLWEPNMGPGQLFECISQVRFQLSGRSFIQSRHSQMSVLHRCGTVAIFLRFRFRFRFRL
jgi:20S proteasome subunit beta 3